MDEMNKIVSIEKFKGKTYCIEFEDGDTIYLHSLIIAQYSLKEGIEIPQSAIEQIIFDNDFRRAKERALYLLEYRDHSYKELFDKLMRNYSEEVCFAVMDKMVDLRLIDDRKYAKMYARKLFEVKKMGKFKARFEMKKKGISEELIDEMVEIYEDGTIERLKEFVDKKYARYLDDDKGIKKVTSALLRAGYTYSEIKEVLNMYLDEEEY